MTDRSFSFVFVCQAGRLEIDSLVLALSLQRFVTCEFEMVAAVPTPVDRWGAPRREVLDQLARMNVRVVDIENRVDPDYPTGNKVSCLTIPTGKDVRMFLDSDVICLQPFAGGPQFDRQFAAKPADLVTRGLDEHVWRHAYAAAGLVPPARTMSATVSGDPMPPYFNAGVIAVAGDSDLGETWAECCRAIDADPRVHPKRPWLDQIALPVAVHKLGLDVELLSEQHNFPAHLRRIDDRRPPVFCHYHDPRNLLRSRHAASVLGQLGDEHPFVWELLRSDPAWRPVARRLDRPSPRRRIGALPGVRQAKPIVDRTVDGWHVRRIPPDELARDAIVTGFPRSGTSLFSALLNSVPNAVCLNEVGAPSRTFRSFRTIRERIAAGRPVLNKYDGSGALVTDTMPGGVQQDRRVVDVVDDRFVLAQKHTLPYLNRLEALCDAGIAVWVLVRHPLFAIDSWKRCPPHFAIARIDPPDPLLAHIPLTVDDADERRAAIWNHYAGRIDRLRGRLEIVRYEDLVADPGGQLARFCARFGLDLPASVAPLDSRNRDDAAFDPAFAALIRERCELGLFGYE